ncbi:hypothetical protein GCM10009527_047450 [Actinomadura nitritigenes]|uniref:DUF397 domain-containing protein n=1 Tax=Actinomadura nitritigenes TaxID=134602 RepID=A0ABS3QTI2_9ACTN|nr:DUF397 domain-containing protein [Actinomadura nitritigenes]MBO2437279.1 DUF397 domain-containing protein [Actinomadura nitritigenes]
MRVLKYRRASRCEELNQQGCVEVANGPGFVAVRDSTDRNGPVILVTRRNWQRLMQAVNSEAL